MSAPILTTVQTEGTTLWARCVGTISAVVTSATTVGILTAEHGEKILGFITSPKVAAYVILGGVIINALTPAIQGWRSKDKELPKGLTTNDVSVTGTLTPVSDLKK